ncbi:hypothetical protein LOTGIDRAFT_234682 [Lottia gigantea]|uniref:UBZ4-type domain-containing protein n=1 Tax=Lottia gigantea TaxID=225164 RepID=V3ZAU1_LOTGI|nr:hypothetical protein LOTGIDRAFT_234682 [Lottia gigantea]ESO88103.1 hypothetical protein LOTGIDRAFT_234682 [Lottia gigantea]
MSNLLHHTACSKSKQETLTGFFKKMSEKPAASYVNQQSEPIIIDDSKECDNLNKTQDNLSTLSTKVSKFHSPKKLNAKNNGASYKDLFSSSKLICPVCDKEIYCGVNGMSLHVEKCLKGENSKEPTMEVVPASDSVYQVTAPDKPQLSKPSTSCQSSVFTCPICDQQKQCSSLEEFNLHVDACLSKDTIKEILQQQKSSSTEILNTKKRRLNGEDKKSDQVSKKKKTKSNSKVKTKSIESFFKS